MIKLLISSGFFAFDGIIYDKDLKKSYYNNLQITSDIKYSLKLAIELENDENNFKNYEKSVEMVSNYFYFLNIYHLNIFIPHKKIFHNNDYFHIPYISDRHFWKDVNMKSGLNDYVNSNFNEIKETIKKRKIDFTKPIQIINLQIFYNYIEADDIFVEKLRNENYFTYDNIIFSKDLQKYHSIKKTIKIENIEILITKNIIKKLDNHVENMSRARSSVKLFVESLKKNNIHIKIVNKNGVTLVINEKEYNLKDFNEIEHRFLSRNLMGILCDTINSTW